MAAVATRLGQAIAALDSDAFGNAFLTWLEAAVPHDNAALLAYFQDRNPELLLSRSRTPEVHANMERTYLTGAYLLDPFHDLHLRRDASGVYRLSDIAPDHFQRNKYFIDYYRQTTLVDELAFVSYPSKGISLQLCLGRDRESNSRFSNAVIAQARSLAPIVEAMLNRQWSKLDTRGHFDAQKAHRRLADAAQHEHGIRLTPREVEVVMLILKGHSSASVGYQLEISYQTVKVFRRQIYRKCNISTQAELFQILVPLLHE